MYYPEFQCIDSTGYPRVDEVLSAEGVWEITEYPRSTFTTWSSGCARSRRPNSTTEIVFQCSSSCIFFLYLLEANCPRCSLSVLCTCFCFGVFFLGSTTCSAGSSSINKGHFTQGTLRPPPRPLPSCSAFTEGWGHGWGYLSPHLFSRPHVLSSKIYQEF